MTRHPPGPCPRCGARPVVVQTSVHAPAGEVRAGLAVDAVGPVVVPGEREAVWARVLAIAEGCHDYSGGHHEARVHEAFHHGISTVVNALTSAAAGAADLQLATLERIGRAALAAKGA